MRAIRHASGQTQSTVSDRAGVSQTVYSRAERGKIVDLKLGTLDRIASALGAQLVIELRYAGGRADRLIDQAHAAIVEIVVAVLRSAGWETQVEFSFNVFGERGSVDILGWHAATRTLLIVEVKSRFTDLQALLLSLGRKLRLVPDVVRADLDWDPLSVGRVVVAIGSAENRSIVERHPSIFDVTLPARAQAIRRWIREPIGPIAGVWLMSDAVIPSRTRRRGAR